MGDIDSLGDAHPLRTKERLKGAVWPCISSCYGIFGSLYARRLCTNEFLFGSLFDPHLPASMAALSALVALRLLFTFSSLPELLQDSHQLTTPLTSHTRCEQGDHHAAEANSERSKRGIISLPTRVQPLFQWTVSPCAWSSGKFVVES